MQRDNINRSALFSDSENYTGQYQLLQLAKTKANMT